MQLWLDRIGSSFLQEIETDQMWRSQNLDDTNETAAAFLTFQGLILESILDWNFRSKIQAKKKKIQSDALSF